MILRRIATSLKRQDWVTVLIEFVLVILGILIALQLDNWNQARLERQLEVATVKRLFVELNSNIEAYGERISLYADYRRTIYAYYDFLDGAQGERPSEEDLDRVLCRQGVTFSGRQSNSVYKELISAGRLGIVSDVTARDALSNFHADVASAVAFTANLAPVRHDVYANLDDFRTRVPTNRVMGGVKTCTFDYGLFEADPRAKAFIAELGYIEGGLIEMNSYVQTSVFDARDALILAYPKVAPETPELLETP